MKCPSMTHHFPFICDPMWASLEECDLSSHKLVSNIADYFCASSIDVFLLARFCSFCVDFDN